MKSKKAPKNRPQPSAKNGAWIVAGVLALTVLPDLFIKKKGYFHAIETIPGFFALLGFASALILFVVAKALEPLLKRREDYYE